MDAQYGAKLMAEVERYQALLSEKELMAERWARAGRAGRRPPQGGCRRGGGGALTVEA